MYNDLIDYFPTREAAHRFLIAEGYVYDRHEPWGFSDGVDFYRRGADERAGLQHRSAAQKRAKHSDMDYVIQRYRSAQ